jgi:DNA repair protein RecO (recombination protein O)
MLHKTKAIVLKTVPYSESSLVVKAFTEQFGLQSYMIKGARRVSKKGGSQAQYFQPAALLELVVYHNELKQLQLIKETRWATIYERVLTNVTRNAVAQFMVEMLTKCIRQEEVNESLFRFAEQNLLILDQAENAVVANLPLHFALQLAAHLGFQPEDNYSELKPILDLQEGRFVADTPNHSLYLVDKLAETTFALLQTGNPITLYRVKLNQATRRQLLEAYELFFQYHINDFGRLKTVRVLEAVLE